jgi:DNA-directed RNA polymerase specialized sigma24 family protein
MRSRDDRRRYRALSDAQRAEADRHIPLVYLQLARQPGAERRAVPDRDAEDLAQEGFVALAIAVRDYSKRRHGTFAAYAIARIHCAMSRTLYERIGGIRVPFATRQRVVDRLRPSSDGRSTRSEADAGAAERRLASMNRSGATGVASDRVRRGVGVDRMTEGSGPARKAVVAEADREPTRFQPARSVSENEPRNARRSPRHMRPGLFPREFRGVLELSLNQDRVRFDPRTPPSAGPLIRHLYWERYVALARELARDMTRRKGAPDRTRMVRACLEERWLVSQPGERTSLRDIAARFDGCLWRVTHAEKKFHQCMPYRVGNDPAVRWLAARAATSREGMMTALEEAEVAEFESVCRIHAHAPVA